MNNKMKISELEKNRISQVISALSYDQLQIALEAIPSELLIREYTRRFDILANTVKKIYYDIPIAH